MEAESRVKDSRASWIFLAITGLVVGLVGGLFDSFGILVVIFVEYFDETNAKIGWVGSLSYALLCFTYPFAVTLCRRFGFRPVAVSSAILVFIAFLTTPSAPSANFLFITYSIPFGLGLGFIDCLSTTILTEYFEQSLGLAMGIRFASVAAASMAFSFLYPILITNMGWKKTMFGLSSTGATMLFYAYSYRKPGVTLSDRQIVVAKESDVKAASEEIEPRSKSGKFLQDRGFQLIVIGCIPFYFAVGVPFMFMPQYAKSIGYPLSQSKWLLVVRCLASLIGRFIMGFIGDFAFRHGVITHIAGTTVTTFGLANGLCSLTQFLPLMILYMGVIGCLEGMYWVIIPLMMNELTRGVNTDYAYSRMYVLLSFGYLTGPSTMGWVYDVTGDFRNVLYVVCACGLVSGVTTGLGIYVRSQYSDRGELPNEITCWRKLTSCNFAPYKEAKLKLELEKESLALYETTV